jgi:hypothetical protein
VSGRTLVLANVSRELCEAVGEWLARYDRLRAALGPDLVSMGEVAMLADDAAKLIRALNLDAVAKIATTEDL